MPTGMANVPPLNFDMRIYSKGALHVVETLPNRRPVFSAQDHACYYEMSCATHIRITRFVNEKDSHKITVGTIFRSGRQISTAIVPIGQEPPELGLTFGLLWVLASWERTLFLKTTIFLLNLDGAPFGA